MQNYNNSYSISDFPELLLRKRGMLMYLILGIALIGFEAINFSTTQYALTDLLGSLKFAGLQWATILSIAFCGIDFAGIARLFLPEESDDQAREVWYLFGAWLLAATMNATLTWWGVSMALSQHTIRSTEIIDPKLLMQAVPVIVALVVWVTRILLIGSFSRVGSHMGHVPTRMDYSPTWERARTNHRAAQASAPRPIQQPALQAYNSPPPATQRPSHRPQPAPAPTLAPLVTQRPAQKPAPLITSRPLPSPPPVRPNPLPQPVEPEYIPDGEDQVISPLPSLRPLTALNARSKGSDSEKRF